MPCGGGCVTLTGTAVLRVLAWLALASAADTLAVLHLIGKIRYFLLELTDE